MKLPVPEFLQKLKEDFLSGKQFDLPEEDFEDCGSEGVSQEELEQLPVFQALHSSIKDGMTLDALIDAFAAMCKLPVGEPDDLLFETGTFDFTGKKLFYFSLVRQFQFRDEDEYVQLHMDVRYHPSPATTRLQCTEWGSLTEGDFFAMIRSGKAYSAVKDLPIMQVEVYIEET